MAQLVNPLIYAANLWRQTDSAALDSRLANPCLLHRTELILVVMFADVAVLLATAATTPANFPPIYPRFKDTLTMAWLSLLRSYFGKRNLG